MNKAKRTASLAFLSVYVLFFSHVSLAQNPQDDWEFDVEAYAFLVNINGDAQVGRDGNMSPDSELDLSTSDVFDMLKMSVMLRTEGLYQGRWGYIVDYSYMDLAEGGQLGELADMGVDAFQSGLTVKGFRRFEQDFGHIDLVAGLRWWHNEFGVNADIDIAGRHFEGGRDMEVDWVDYVVGTRVAYNINRRWQYYLDLDAGMGKDTDFAAEVQTGFKRYFDDDSYLRLGFKSVWTDYDDNEEFAYDTASWGLMVGYGIHF